METYEQISETEVKVTTETIVDISLIENEVTELQKQVDKELLEYPIGVSVQIATAIDQYNEPILANRIMAEKRIAELQAEILKYTS